MQQKSQLKIPEPEFVLSRLFNAPKDLVFRSFLEPAHLACWWAPKGFRLGVKKLDIRPGGELHYSMTSADGLEMFGKFGYIEINSPDLIVFTNAFSDSSGNITRAPFSVTWPLKIINVWTFEENVGKTTLTIKGSAYTCSPEEKRTFLNGFESLKEGFGTTLKQLEEYLLTIE